MYKKKLHMLVLLLLARGLSLCVNLMLIFFYFKYPLKLTPLFIAVDVHKS